MKRIPLMLLALVIGALAWGAGSQEPMPAAEPASQTAAQPVEEKPSGTIAVYTSVPQNIVDNIKIDFEEKNPEITMDIFRSGTSKVLAKIKAEQEAGNIAADVIWVADFSVMENLKAEGLLQAYKSPNASNIPARYYDPEGYYYGSRMMYMVLGYNPNMVSRKPTSWKDVLAPEYEGKIGSATPSRSGAFMVAAGAMVRHPDFGWEYFEQMAAHGNVIGSNSGIAKKIASGEVALGYTLDYIARKMKAEGSPIDFVYPEEGAVMTPSPIAIMRASKNPKASRAFIDYTLTQSGQQALADNGFIPLVDGVSSPYPIESLKDIPTMDTVDYAWIRENSLELMERFDALHE